MKLQTQKKSFVAALLLFVVSCGRNETQKAEGPSFSLEDNSQLEKRFTETEIAKVYTQESAPKQTQFLESVYTMETAPEQFKAEFPDFTRAVEFKGFFNMSAQPTGGEPNDDPTARRIVSTLQTFSTWKEIRDSSNRLMFDDAYTTDRYREKMPDVTNGKIRSNPDFHFGAIVGSGLTIGLELQFKKMENGRVDADITNPRDISAFPVGTIVKARNLKIHLEFFPYKNGWLYYGAAAPKLEKFTEKAEQLNETARSILLWVQQKVGK